LSAATAIADRPAPEKRYFLPEVEFPGGKVRDGESPEVALARELQEELGVTLVRSVEIGRVHHHYAGTPEELEIRFFAAAIANRT